MSYGFKGWIGIGKETNWGTSVAATDWFEGLSENLSASIDRFDIKNIVGTVAEPDDDTGTQRVAGDIVIPAMPQALGYFLKAAMQQVSGSVVTSGFLWKNTFNTALSDFSADTPMQPYSIEVFRDVTSSVLYKSCVMNALELSFAPNQPIQAKGTWLGYASTIQSASGSQPSYPGSPSKPFNFTTLSLSIGGSGTARVEDLKLMVNNNLEGIPALNASQYIAKVRRKGPQTIGLTGTLDFTDMTEYLDFINQTERQWKMNMTAANSCALTIDIPRMQYVTFPLGIPGRQRITVGFTGKAFYSSGSGTAITFGLTNVKSFY